MLLMVIVSMIAGCAGNEKRLEPAAGFGEAEAGRIDPYEGFNRAMYSFDMKVDQYFLKPVADGYKFISWPRRCRASESTIPSPAIRNRLVEYPTHPFLIQA